MKVLLVVLLLIIGGVGYLLFGPSDDRGVPAQEQPAVTADRPAQNQPGGGSSTTVTTVRRESAEATADSDKPIQRMPVGTSFVEDAAAVGSYAVGHTQVMIKNRVGKKIDETNKKHNEKLNDLMN